MYICRSPCKDILPPLTNKLPDTVWSVLKLLAAVLSAYELVKLVNRVISDSFVLVRLDPVVTLSSSEDDKVVTSASVANVLSNEELKVSCEVTLLSKEDDIESNDPEIFTVKAYELVKAVNLLIALWLLVVLLIFDYYMYTFIYAVTCIWGSITITRTITNQWQFAIVAKIIMIIMI